MTLDKTIKAQLKQYLGLLESDVVFQASLGQDERSAKVQAFLEEIVAMSPRLSLENIAASRQPSFTIAQAGQTGRVQFAGLPLGHEFTSFVLALLQVSGRAPKVEDAVIDRIRAIKQTLHFETYVSLTCHNCPDVVQALNMMAILNPTISHTMVEGGMFREEVENKKVMAVPTVFLNGDEFANGRMTIEQLLDKLSGPASSEEYSLLVENSRYCKANISGDCWY